MQELLNQLQTPAWWIAAAIAGVVGNLASGLLAWLFPRAVRNAVPAARVLVWTYATALVLCAVYVAAVAPEDWHLMHLPQRDELIGRVMFVVVVLLSAAVFPSLDALYGPPSAPLVVAAVLSCWTGLVLYVGATFRPSAPAIDLFLMGAYVWSLFGSGLALLVSVPFLPSTARNVVRQAEHKGGRGS